MQQPGFFDLMSFGPGGWGPAMLTGALVTLALALCGFAIGAVFGAVAAFAKIAGGRIARTIADIYTTVLRGIPDLLVIYLFYFGGSTVLTSIGRLFGHDGFIGLPGFATGAIAIGIVSGAQHTEVFRGAFRAVHRGEIEAAIAAGMHPFLRFRRIIAPLVLRYALPGLGNIWQIVLKESALVSVTGVVELLRQAQVGAGSERQPFTFYFAAAILYLVITSLSSITFRQAEGYFSRGVRRSR
ncbi:ABC transporter permease [Consotaella salsifontis]|uniref:Amino acid ABC transporter membrane protein 1, PAAT family n=1 Tax=Consotaella salsifontis TaxID=1365950 RepID=A0A1T4SDD5_9HYPH|nr:ABC transporter permease subunit [Consotaella salsifontis]SKA26243.1 amino acid ABC transporter membrane protein 1, PAAT family [Consotaella salsifontis]